jgi:type IX secretion system PorP/SprF family membrane protein
MSGFAQDAVFSQYYASTLYLNPALAAVEPTATLNLNSRQQWKNAGDGFSTNQLSLIFPIKDGGILDENIGGVGVTVFTDNTGDGNLKTTGFYATGSYILKLSHQQHILLGLQGGYMTRSLDLESFTWNSQYNDQIGWDGSIDPGNDNLNDNVGMVDLSAGIFYYNTQKEDVYKDGRGLYLGLSAYHLNQASNSLVEGGSSKLGMLIKAHGGVGLPVKKKMVLSPNFLVASQNELMQINVGTYLDYLLAKKKSAPGIVPTNAYLGVWYRVQDSFIMSLGFGSDSYTFGFSYDMNTSTLGKTLRGSSAYEISLKIRKPPKKAIIYHQPRV